jgi:hypothetical protein
MNKRIKKKHRLRFNLRLLGFSFFELEQALGHEIDHKIKRSLANRRYREYRKEPKNGEMVELTTSMLEKMWLASIEQSFYPMDYYEIKSMEENKNDN